MHIWRLPGGGLILCRSEKDGPAVSWGRHYALRYCELTLEGAINVPTNDDRPPAEIFVVMREAL
jgi:hypothetical protein